MKEFDFVDLDEDLLAQLGVDPAIVRVLRDIADGQNGCIRAHQYMAEASAKNENVQKIAEMFTRLTEEGFVDVVQESSDDAVLRLTDQGKEFLRSLR